METKNSTHQKLSFSPMDSYRWIEQGLFSYLQDEKILEEQALDEFRDIYHRQFAAALKKVTHLIRNDLDRGNIHFTLIAVAAFEAFLENEVPQQQAILLTDKAVNSPIRAYIAQETKKDFDLAEDPFQTLVQASKEREKHYFGSSFEFERPVDNEHGYVLNIKKCLFHETLNVLNRNELQPILCRMDLSWINSIDPEKHLMQFARPVTFATGNSCQFWFMRKEKEWIKD